MISAIEQLKNIGLNKLEAEVYFLLLSEEPMTAYRIGKLLNKPTANIYKAVDALTQKGAVVIQLGTKNKCKAVNYDEFLKTLRSQFESKSKKLSEALANIKKQERDEGVYTLQSLELVFEKAKSMIDNCDSVITLGVFPDTFIKIKENILNAIERGVRINLLTYGEIEVEGAKVTFLPIKNSSVITWKSQQLNLITDGKESLISSFDLENEHIFHASWSTSIYLSSVLHQLFLFEHTLNELMGTQDAKNKLEKIESILKSQEFFHNSDIPGFKILLEKHIK